jgi:hypothetical protein
MELDINKRYSVSPERRKRPAEVGLAAVTGLAEVKAALDQLESSSDRAPGRDV